LKQKVCNCTFSLQVLIVCGILRNNCIDGNFQVVKALHYLQAELKVIHRDVKPSNILINRNGQVKMCDFGISGNLVDSVAKTIDAGCKPYMAVCL
jgi:serine/threonine protein kinase